MISFLNIIEDNWDDILATIKLKETTASEIFRRLNSYSKQHALYRALKTFGKIIKSIFILRYIDDLELRQAIEKQLNKIENSHQSSRAVSIGNPREFTQAEKQEQEVAEGCKRLIKNAITCWNYLYLSQKISETMGPEAAIFPLFVPAQAVSSRHVPPDWLCHPLRTARRSFFSFGRRTRVILERRRFRC
jgi:TnpA family transposase